jgi:hypothetical protein
MKEWALKESAVLFVVLESRADVLLSLSCSPLSSALSSPVHANVHRVYAQECMRGGSMKLLRQTTCHGLPLLFRRAWHVVGRVCAGVKAIACPIACRSGEALAYPLLFTMPDFSLISLVEGGVERREVRGEHIGERACCNICSAMREAVKPEHSAHRPCC